MKKLFIVSLIVLIVVGFAFHSYAKPKGTLRVSMTTFAYETFDPIVGESFFGWQMYDPIVTWDKEGNFIGGLAKSWKLSPDGKTWTFKVRKGVKFHNGDPVTSADLMFSVKHMQDPKSWNPWSPYLRYNCESMSCPDDYTFVYKTNKPEPTLIMCFAATRVLPKKYIEKNGLEHFRKNPIGSGPWKLVSFTSGDNCVMEANTKHWRIVPHFEKLIQYVVPEESTQIAMLKRGEVDIITGISLDQVVKLRDEGWRIRADDTPTGVVLNFPGTFVTDGPMGDKRIRQALAYSINYQELCDTFFRGFAKPGGRFFMYNRVWGWDPNWKPEPYDPEKAKALLKEAGYPGKFKTPVITIYVQVGTGWTPDLMQVIQGYWAEAGIQTKIELREAMEWGGLFFVRNTKPDAPNVGAIFPWAWPNFYASNVYHSYNMYCPGGVHSTSDDQHALELYTKAIRELDPVKAEQYWTDFQNYCHDEMFINFGVCLVYNQLVLGPKVGEFGWGTWLSPYEAYADLKHK